MTDDEAASLERLRRWARDCRFVEHEHVVCLLLLVDRLTADVTFRDALITDLKQDRTAYRRGLLDAAALVRREAERCTESGRSHSWAEAWALEGGTKKLDALAT